MLRVEEPLHHTLSNFGETRMKVLSLAAGLAIALAPTFAASASDKPAAGVQIDPKIPAYQKTSDAVSGDIKSVGSDTMAELVPSWASGFKKFYPDVKAEIESKGSSTAPPALINGTANFGPMSRDWEPSEIDDFEKKYGY